jgi:hypothetical protein
MTLALLIAAAAAAAAWMVRRRILAAEAMWAVPGADFFPFQHHLGGEAGVAVNPEATALCLARAGRDARLLLPEQLVRVEVVEDGVVVMRRDRAADWDGWERDHDPRAHHLHVRRLALRIAVADGDEPVHEVTFLDSAASKDSSAYRQAMAQVQHWYGVVGTVLRR